ncbi:hypothetical protein [Arthrobacter sp. H35-D1]|uniref:WXG100 family type VII secretion target n=1 Tax=Arthrobacter sp. H35-D1 TaxID=3046202 RepID=UPI0024BBB653|nr:hypothetical protein [Arthrobacter sp. H35-D1]MDJ0312914.1 hypothetical protein [Arthrobacter sp. H35-D1]
MNENMLGADPAQLRELATLFNQSSQKLRRTVAMLHPVILHSRWQGPDAARMRSDWQGRMRPQLNSAQDLLTTTAKTLVAQAAEQEKASSSDSGDGGDGGDGGSEPGFWDRTLQRIKDGAKEHLERVERHNELKDELHSMRDASEAEVRAWWEGLSEEEQKYIIEGTGPNNVPLAVELAALKGSLPPDVRRAVNDYLVEKGKESIPMYTDDGKFRVEGQVAWVHGEAHIGATITENADGSATVKVSGGAGGGVNTPGTKAGVDATLSGEISRTYEFSSRKEAEAALDQMVDDLPPDGFGNAKDAVSNPADYVMGTLDNAAKENGSLRSTDSALGSISVGGHGGLNDDASVSARLEMDYEQNLSTGTSTAGLTVSAKADLDLGAGQSLSGDGSARIHINMNEDHSIERLTLTVQGTLAMDQELRVDTPGTPIGQKDGLSATSGVGGQGSVKMEIYNTEENKDLISSYLTNQASGNDLAAASDLKDIYEASGVTLQVNAVAHTEDNLVDVDTGVASLKVGTEREVTSNISTGYKPPHGAGFEQITRDEG